MLRNGTEDISELYCLDADKQFPIAEVRSFNNIGKLGDLNDPDISSYKTELGEDKYKSLVWFANNIITQTAEEDPEVLNYLEKAFKELIDFNYENNVEFSFGGKTYNGSSDKSEYGKNFAKYLYKDKTVEDINVVQQLALWYLNMPTADNPYFSPNDLKTNNNMGEYKNGYNPETRKFAYQLPIIRIGTMIFSDASEVEMTFYNLLFSYLVTNALRAENTSISNNYPTLKRLDTKVQTGKLDNQDYFIVGPFEVDGTLGSNNYNILINNGELPENYKLLNKDFVIIENKKINDILNQEYYIAVPSNTNINELKLTIDYADVITNTATVWQTSDDKYQRVVLIEPIKSSKQDETITVPILRGDLALRKFIVSVDGKPVAEELKHTPNLTEKGVENITNDANYIAKYNHSKVPAEVEIGSKVVYQINVYNEGDIDGIAKEITDYLPDGLIYDTNSEINDEYNWIPSGKTIKTDFLNETTLTARDGENIASAFVRIECIVADTVTPGRILTNVAEITDDNIIDKDSKVGSVNGNTIDDTYSGNRENKTELNDENYFYKGLQDDDDFAKVIIKGGVFDLSLKKFITEINGKAPTKSREIKVTDTTPLKNGGTNAKYSEPVKTPLTVKSGDVVKYTIRIFNEGTISGYAEQVADYLPEGLGLLVFHKDNYDNAWDIKTALANGAKTIKLSQIENGTANLRISDFSQGDKLEDVDVLVGNRAKIISTKLSSNVTSNLLTKFDEKSNSLDYKDIEVTCIVLADGLEDSQLKNIAEIMDDSDEDKNEIEDRDSKPDTVKPENYPGGDKTQDDHDYENLTEVAKKFDLALQKFITGLNDQKITDRAPAVSKGEDGKLKYNHTTDPLKTANTDLVTYTIRVYNEGELDGYAAEIQDDIPSGLIFMADNEVNKAYGWKMYDKYGKETADLSQATSVKTTYLSKEASEARKDNALIKAYDSSMKSPDFKDVQIVFKVDDSKIDRTATTEKRIIINTAEISENQDEKGNKIEDIDSTPANGKENEDDIDKERIYVKYFDLALQKYLTKIIITEDGQTREIVANDKESLLKVEVDRKKIKTTVVKFMYDIVITNQGEIEGFATEIKDYIPEGLKFLPEDNKDWVAISEKEVVTNALAKTLIEPGKDATVSIVLTWINGENNLGIKTNVAEISEDYNTKGDTPDIDSTPNNNKDAEDDIDDAPVMLAISTGAAKTYIGLSLTVTVISAAGVALIKKYVL